MNKSIKELEYTSRIKENLKKIIWGNRKRKDRY